jgi:hypothetical protein
MDNEQTYKDNLKYRSLKLMLRNSMSLKSKEAVSWRKSVRNYLQNFEDQWEGRNTPTWKIDDEVFDNLQRQAQSLMLDL